MGVNAVVAAWRGVAILLLGEGRMKQEDIIRMAEEAGKHLWPLETEFLLRFAELVRADEREECAKLCDGLNFIDNGTPAGTRATNRHCAAAIRARGQA